jgi:hypothetical protein
VLRREHWRRCQECGYSWQTHESGFWFGQRGVITSLFTGSGGLNIFFMGSPRQVLADSEPLNEVREADRHCPQCDSTHYTNFRVKRGSKPPQA